MPANNPPVQSAQPVPAAPAVVTCPSPTPVSTLLRPTVASAQRRPDPYESRTSRRYSFSGSCPRPYVSCCPVPVTPTSNLTAAKLRAPVSVPGVLTLDAPRHRAPLLAPRPTRRPLLSSTAVSQPDTPLVTARQDSPLVIYAACVICFEHIAKTVTVH